MNTLLLLFLVVPSALAAGIVIVLLMNPSKGDRAMARLAMMLGMPWMGGQRIPPEKGLFSFRHKPVFILDVWHGRELNIYHFTRGAERMRTAWVALDVPVKVSPELRMSFTAVGWITQASLQPGLKSVQTGDASFDNRFSVRSSDADLALSVLSPALRESFVRSWSGHDVRGVLSVREGRIHYEEAGPLTSGLPLRRMVAMVALCHALAESLDKAGV